MRTDTKTSDEKPTDRGPRRLARRSALTFAAASGGAVTFLALCCYLVNVPILNLAGFFVASYAGPMILIGVGAALLALVARRLGSGRGAVVVAGIATVGVLASALLLGLQVQAAKSNGVSVNAAEALLPGRISDGGSPDETVQYTTDQGKPLTIDVYRPRGGGNSPAPVVMYTHGGGWIQGSSRSQTANLEWFADHGYLALAVNYTLATAEHATWDTALPQILCSYAWAGQNAANYGGDPNRFFVWGESAGGALALSSTYSAADGGTSACGALPAVRAVFADVPAVDPVSFYNNSDPFWGSYARTMVRNYLGGTPAERSDRAEAVSSANFISPSAPPTYITLSNNDHLVPVEGADAFIADAQAAKVDLTVVRRPLADHATTLVTHSVSNQFFRRAALSFFADHGSGV